MPDSDNVSGAQQFTCRDSRTRSRCRCEIGKKNVISKMTANTEQWTGIHRHHYVIGILLQIQRKIKLIDNWSNKTDTLRHRIQRTAGEVLEPANNYR